jgi:hypothetical protein
MESGQLPAMPTPQDVQAMFDRASEAAARAETAAQRLEAAEGAARTETEARFPGMPEKLVEQVSKATAEQVVAAMEARYELASSGPPTGPPASGQADASATPSAPGSVAGQEPGVDPPPATDSPRNLAHRILGY